jgi:hypothetical protein
MAMHQQAWSIAVPGRLSISSLTYLLIASPARRDNAPATLTEIRLGKPLPGSFF